MRSMIDRMNTRSTDLKTQVFDAQQAYSELLAEQSRLVARLGEITALLSAVNPPTYHKTVTSDATTPPGFDRKAYAIGLLWRNPTISTRELAQKVGVARSTLFLPSWSDVATVIRARGNLSLRDYKNHHLDNEDDE